MADELNYSVVQLFACIVRTPAIFRWISSRQSRRFTTLKADTSRVCVALRGTFGMAVVIVAAADLEFAFRLLSPRSHGDKQDRT